jgi:hypothetical protein
MSVYDQIAANAKAKKGYIDTSKMGAVKPVAPKKRITPTPTPRNPAPVTVPGISGSPTRSKALADFRAGRTGDKPDEGFNPLGSVGRAVAGGFGSVINVADATRRGAQGYMGEVGDLMSNLPGPVERLANTALLNPFQLRGLKDEDGERDQSFDFGEIRDRVTGDNQISEGFLGHADWDDDMPGWMRPAVGFAGDILTDPLTYLTAGTVKAGSVVAGQAGRVALSQAVVKNAATEAGQKVAPKVVDDLAREVGRRGAGALTEKGLRRSGASVDDLVNLGLKPDWGVSVGVGKARVAVPGSRRVAERAADIKGSVKKFTGASGAGRLSRQLFNSVEHGEAKARQAIMSGSPDAATAARGLVVLGNAKGDSYLWFNQAARELADVSDGSGRKLAKLSPEEAAGLTRALEAGDYSNPAVARLAEFFEKRAKELQEMGVEFNTRQGYVPHRLSDKAIRMLNAGDEDIRVLLDDGLDRPELFQKLRQSDESVDVINARWRQNHDYDLLETDVRKLAAQYLGEGQEAVMKAKLTGGLARDLGLIDDVGRGIDGTKVQKMFDAEVAKEAEQISKSVVARRMQINKATRLARQNVGKTSQELTQVKSELAKAERKIGAAQARQAKLQANMDSLTQARDLAEAAARSARGKEKAAADLKLREVEETLSVVQQNWDRAKSSLDNATTNKVKLQAKVVRAQEEFSEYEKVFSDLMDDRKALDNAPVAKTAVQAQQAADKAAAARQAAADKFATAQSDTAAAETTAAWIQSDVKQVADRVTAQLAEFDDWSARVDATKKRGRPTMDSNKALRDEQRVLLTEIRDVLKNSDDPIVQQMAKLEAQAIVADAAALMGNKDMLGSMARKRMQADFDAGIDLLSNPKFQEYVIPQLTEGMERLKRQLGDDVQINAWYKEMIETHRKFIDPTTRSQAFRGMQTMMRAYGRAMNWWKGWALASPGFVVRNLYSGMFAMHLDNVNPFTAGRFYNYLKRAEADPVKAANWATDKFGPVEAARLHDAHRVASASGFGQTTEELARQTKAGTSWVNPGSANFAPVKGLRFLSGESEAYLRGGHAYAVLERGGSFEEALSRVEKFHFNYRDLSEFDVNAKKVMPFWTFWSRNMGLQASVFAQKPQKITRSFYNAKRNIEESADPDGGSVPWYMQNDMAGILSPFGSEEGKGRMYFTPDIPSARFPGQTAAMLDEPGLGILKEVVQGAAPPIKAPIQLMTNKNFFQDRPYRNSLETFTDDGPAPRYAPGLFQAPGVRDVLGMLPGAEVIDGKLLMQDNVEGALMDVNPLLSRAGRLPGVQQTQRQQDTNRQFWLNFFGAGVRWNDPGSQRGADAAAARAGQEAADKVQERIRLEGLVRGG